MGDNLDLIFTLTMVAEGLDRIQALEDQFAELRTLVNMPLEASVKFEARNVEAVKNSLKGIADSGVYNQRQMDATMQHAEAAAGRVARSIGYVQQVGESVENVYSTTVSAIEAIMRGTSSAAGELGAQLSSVEKRLENFESLRNRLGKQRGRHAEFTDLTTQLTDLYGKLPLTAIEADPDDFKRFASLTGRIQQLAKALGLKDSTLTNLKGISTVNKSSTREMLTGAAQREVTAQAVEIQRRYEETEQRIVALEQERVKLQEQISATVQETTQNLDTADLQEYKQVIEALRRELEQLKTSHEQLTSQLEAKDTSTRRRPKGRAADGGAEVAGQIVQEVLVAPKLEGEFKIPVDRAYIIEQIQQAIQAANELQLKVGVTFEGLATETVPTASPPPIEGLKAVEDHQAKLEASRAKVEAAQKAMILEQRKWDSASAIARSDADEYAKVIPLLRLMQEQFEGITQKALRATGRTKDFGELYQRITAQMGGLPSTVQTDLFNIGSAAPKQRANIIKRTMEAADTASDPEKMAKVLQAREGALERLTEAQVAYDKALADHQALLDTLPDQKAPIPQTGPVVEVKELSEQKAAIQELQQVSNEAVDPGKWEAVGTAIREAFNVGQLTTYTTTLKNTTDIQERLYGVLERSPAAFQHLDLALQRPLEQLRTLENMLNAVNEHIQTVASRTDLSAQKTSDAFTNAAQALSPSKLNIGGSATRLNRYSGALQTAAEKMEDFIKWGGLLPNVFYELETPLKTTTEHIREQRTAVGELVTGIRNLREGIRALADVGQNAAAPLSEFTASLHMALGQVATPGGERLAQIAEQTAQTQAIDQHTEALKKQVAVTEELRKESERLQKELKTLQDKQEQQSKKKPKEEKPPPTVLDDFRRRFRTLGVFAPTATVVFGITMAIRRGIQDAVKLETALADIQGVLPSRNISDRFRIEDAVIRSARDYGVAITEVAQAAKFFAQAGYVSPQAIADASRVAMMGVKGAGLTPQEAQELILALRAITQGAVEAEEVLDRISRIEARRAVSSQDLFQVITRVGPIAEQLKGDAVGILDGFDLIMGATTGIIERTRITGSQAATSLRFIIARLGSPDIVRNLQQIGGVKLAADEAGQTLRPLREILQDLAISYERLQKSGQTGAANQLLVQLGGARQLSATTALLQSFLREGLQTARDGALAFGDLAQRTKVSLNTVETSLTRTRSGLTQLGSSLIQFPGVHYGVIAFFNILGSVAGDTGNALNALGRSLRNAFINPYKVDFLTQGEVDQAPRVRQFEKTAREMGLRSQELLEAIKLPALEMADEIAARYMLVGEEVVRGVASTAKEQANLRDILGAFDIGALSDTTLRPEMGTRLVNALTKSIPLFQEYQQKIEATTDADEKARLEKERLAKAFSLLNDAAYLTNAIFGGNVERTRAQVESLSAEIDEVFSGVAKDSTLKMFDQKLLSEGNAATLAKVFTGLAGSASGMFDTILRGTHTFDIFKASVKEVLELDPELQTFGNTLAVMAEKLRELEGVERDQVLKQLGDEAFRAMGFDKIPEVQFRMGLNPQEAFQEEMKKLLKEGVERNIRDYTLGDEEASKIRHLAELLGSSGATEAHRLQAQRDVFSRATDPFAQLIREFVKGERATAAFEGELARLGVTFDPLQAKIDNTTTLLKGLLTFTADTADHLVDLHTKIQSLSTIKVGDTEAGFDSSLKGLGAKDDELTAMVLENSTKRKDAIAKYKDEVEIYAGSLRSVLGEDGMKLTDIFGINPESLKLIEDFQTALGLLEKDPKEAVVHLNRIKDATAARLRSLQDEAYMLRERENVRGHEEQLTRIRADAARTRGSLTSTPEQELRRNHNLEMALLTYRTQRAEQERHKNQDAFDEEMANISRAREQENERLRLGLAAQAYLRQQTSAQEQLRLARDQETAQAQLQNELALQRISLADSLAQRTQLQLDLQARLFEIQQREILEDPALQGDDNRLAREDALQRRKVENQIAVDRIKGNEQVQRYLRTQNIALERSNVLYDAQIARAQLQRDIASQQLSYTGRIADQAAQDLQLQDAIYQIERQRLLNAPEFQAEDNRDALNAALYKLDTEYRTNQLAKERLSIVEAETKLATEMRQNVEQSLAGIKSLFTDTASFTQASGADRFAKLLGPLSENILGNTADELFRNVFDPKASGFFGNLTRSLGGYTADRAKQDLLDTSKLAGALQGKTAGEKLLEDATAIGYSIGSNAASVMQAASGVEGIPSLGISTKSSVVDPKKIPEHLLEPRTVNPKADKETDLRIRNLVDQISLLATSMGTTLGLKGGAGTQTGASLGGAFGQGLGKDAAKSLFGETSKGLGAAIGSAALPVVGTVVGGILGGVLGGMFDKDEQKKQVQSLERIDQNTRQAATVLEVQRQMMETARGAVNVPANFVVPQYTPQGGTVIERINFAPQINVTTDADPDTIAQTIYAKFGNFLTNELSALGLRLN